MTDRGLSVAVNYVLSLAIATLLLSGLLFAVGNVVGDRQDAAVRAELEVVGERVASGLETADRLAEPGADTVAITVETPDRVAGSDYRFDLNATTQQLELRTVDGSITVTVPVENTTAIGTSAADGGDVQVFLTDAGTLEVRNA